jgi:hypothetical protein
VRKISQMGCAVALVAMSLGCDLSTEDLFGDGGVVEDVLECPNVCSKIEACNAEPPALRAGVWGDDVGDNDLAACAGNCAQTETRHRFGYADCQIRCINTVDCDAVQDCWKANSEIYGRFCSVPDNTPVAPPEEQDAGIDNGSTTGSDEVDDLVEDPAINVAIDESDTIIHFGDDPPTLTGHYAVQGEIDRSNNARPAGNPIRTGICFVGGGMSTPEGPVVQYCEDGQPGVANAPIVGNNNAFTLFLEIQGAPVTILFSGEVEEDLSVPAVEALVTYTYAVSMWEHSVTAWEPDNPDCECN